jgi:aspartyl-tRNA(Asn)/glutamyl-tRNA(Gln) amidotransferase subunit C
MELTREEVEHIASLARLSLSDDEVVLYQEQLSDILDYFARLQTIDTSDVPPTATVLPLRSVMRADVAGQELSHEEILANAPEAEDSCFKVPAVMD